MNLITKYESSNIINGDVDLTRALTFCSVRFQRIEASKDCSQLLHCRVLLPQEALHGPGSRQSLLHLLRADQLVRDRRTLHRSRSLY